MTVVFFCKWEAESIKLKKTLAMVTWNQVPTSLHYARTFWKTLLDIVIEALNHNSVEQYILNLRNMKWAFNFLMKAFLIIVLKHQHHTFMFQKQPLEVFFKKRCSQKIRRIHRKATVPKSLNLRCFPVNFTKFLRATFSQNTSGRLLQVLIMEIDYTHWIVFL